MPARSRVVQHVMVRSGLLLVLWILGPGAQPATYHYDVAVEPGLARVAVSARIAPAQRLRARHGRGTWLDDLGSCDGRALRPRDGVVVLPPGVSCVHYRHRLKGRTNPRSPPVAAGVVVSSPSEWLWLPALDGEDQVRIRLTLPDGVAASVPWTRLEDGAYQLRASAGSSRAVAVFGSLDLHRVSIPGGFLEVALIDGPQTTLGEPARSAKLVSWLRTAAHDVARVAGVFPNPVVQVVVQPSSATGWGRGRSPVPFGYVIRDGGEAVHFFVQGERPLEDFLSDWTATHEFSHLLLPYVRSREKWISEGFASYYQNVLLARRGVYSEREAWQRLHDAFTQAAAIRGAPALRDLAQRPFWEVRMLVYWSGAALALLADSALRRDSGGDDSLDAALGRLAGCCLPSARVWSGAELFVQLDTLSARPVFMDLYRRLSQARGMPTLEAVYRQLGVTVGADGTVSLSDAAEHADVRRAIMAPWRERGD